ncbi:MAG: hypothetical protein GXY07_05215 [Candidatus Hydrogenedentes bacterium]|nr:hypothetical protein [Candidatus Hydrogenedentota bacterium]
MDEHLKKNCQTVNGILSNRVYWGSIINHPVLPLVVLFIFSLLPIYYASLRWPYLKDDFFITLTYSKNIALGRGFVYNYGEPTFGSTTPLLVLIGAVLGLLLPWFPLHSLATLFTALCLAGIGWIFLLFHKHFRISPWVAAFLGSSLIISSDPEFLGMEAYLFQFLLVLSCALAFCRCYLSCGVCIALLHLTRAEGVLLLPILMTYAGIADFVKGERDIRRLSASLLRMAIGAGVVAGIWTCYAYITFGRITPNTLSAKLVHLEFFGDAPSFRNYWLIFLNARFRNWGGNFNIVNVFGIALWVLLAYGVYDVIRYRRQWMVFILYFIAHVTGYSIINVLFFRWYALPLIFILMLLVVLGAARLMSTVFTSKPVITTITLMAMMLILFFGAELYRVAEQSRMNWADRRAPTYLMVASWLRNHTKPGSSVSFGEIGYIGYFTDNKIIDTAGLVSPEVIPLLAKGDIISGFLMHKPDYHIWIEGDKNWEQIIRHPFFVENYIQAARITGPKPREVMYIYKRKDVV